MCACVRVWTWAHKGFWSYALFLGGGTRVLLGGCHTKESGYRLWGHITNVGEFLLKIQLVNDRDSASVSNAFNLENKRATSEERA